MTDAPQATPPEPSRPDPVAAPAPDPVETARERLLEALPSHVAFDGWSQAAIDAAAAELDMDAELARLAFPRGGVDAALAFHRRGDRLMAERFEGESHLGMGFTDKVTRCARLRLEVVAEHREAARRAASLFALPMHAADGARALWDTADAIWTTVGDTSDDANWYTKRATLAGVYSSTALYWLGDDSPGFTATWDFLDRRIADVMRIEKTKADLRKNPFTRPLMTVGDRLAKTVKPPRGRGPESPAY